jgi:hypothetical protein
MRQLHHIVDSLNLKFKTCDPWKQYLALSQTRGHFITMDSGNVRAALKDIKAGIPYDLFKKKYAAAKIEENMLVTRMPTVHSYGDNEGKHYVDFSALSFIAYSDISIDIEDTSFASKDLQGQYVWQHYPKGEYNKEYFSAFYFPEPFIAAPLPQAYARMVQYVDCMVDTGKTIFFNEANADGIWSFEKDDKKVRPATPAYAALDALVHSVVITKESKEEDNEEEQQSWLYKVETDSIARDRLDALARSTKFRLMLKAACTETVEKRVSNIALEYLAERYGEPETALFLKRMRIVIGGCSQDQRPRYHALEIARLSAETINWEIFLRAHLDIMNDRFQRVSDGSYAWGKRKTYIHELEELDLDIEQLMLGLCLRISNPSGTHYYGSINRVGRALSEYRDRPALERKMAAMISDNSLDLYNRVLIYFVYRNYQYHRDEKNATENDPALATAVATLPEYIQEQIAVAEKH